LQLTKETELATPEISLEYAIQAREIAQNIDFDSAEVRAMIMIGANYCRLGKLTDAIEIGELIVKKATKYEMNLEVADGKSVMAVAYATGGDFDNSSKLYFENLKLYEELKEYNLMASTLGNIGADFIDKNEFQKGLEYTNKALELGLKHNKYTLCSDMYNNIAAIYQLGYNDNEKALNNYFCAYYLAVKTNDFQQQGINALNIGRLYQNLNENDSSLFYLNHSLSIFENINNHFLIADTYIALGEYYYFNSDIQQSEKITLLGFEISNELGILQTQNDAAQLLHKIYISKKDTASAYKFHIIYTNIKDSLNSIQNENELFKLEFQYNQQKIEKENEIRQIKTYYFFGIIVFVLVSTIFLVILMYSRQKIKIKNTLLEKEKAEASLKFKCKELSVNLMSLLKKNEIISDILKKLIEIEALPPKHDIKESVKKLIQNIRLNFDNKLFDEFSLQFNEINAGFYDKLLEKFPDLTKNELKLCAYLRLNMSTKEIISLTGQTTEALERARYRLRKKFELTNSNINLNTFLLQF